VPITQAVVLLNGGGSRKLLGLTLLKRIILNAHQAGIEEFWLFHRNLTLAQKIILKLSSDRRILDREIRFKAVSSEDVSQKLGQSAGDDYLLIIEDDLVLDPELLPGLAKEVNQEMKEIILIENLKDRARSELCSGMVLMKSSAVLEFLPLMCESSESRSDLLIEAIQEKPEGCSRLRLRTRFCLRVQDKKEFKQAEKLLLQTGRKPTDGFTARLINRRISLFLTRYLLKLNITPVVMSVFTFAVGLLSILFIGYGKKLMLPGAFLFELASVIDGCDGENARLTYRVSKFGGALDVTADAVTFVSFFAALPVGLYRTTGNPLWVYLGIFAFVSMLAFYLQLINYSRKTGIGRNIVAVVKEVEASIKDPDFQNWFDRLASRIAFVYRRDFFATAAFVLIVLGLARLTMVVVAFGAFVEATYFASYSRRQLKKRALDKLQTTGA
jgi:phosphatidylglycerophosphate synthase